MKIPNLKDRSQIYPVPDAYALRISELEAIANMANTDITTDLWTVLYSLYAWGFKRGMSYQKKRQK